jgi:hypothetical protein
MLRSTIFYWLLNLCITNAYILRKLYLLRKHAGDASYRPQRIVDFRLELAQDLIAYAGQLEAAQLRAAASASAPRKSARARAEDEVADPGAPSDGTASDDADDSDSTYCLSPCESDSSEGTDDPDDFIEDVVEGTYDGPVPEAPARGVRRGATPLPVVPGPHVLTHVGKGIRHRCGVCGMMAQVYCSPCEKFLCLNSDRNCYHALHFGGDVAH